MHLPEDDHVSGRNM